MANSNGVLKIPIQINGGDEAPTSSDLKERELYINTEDSILYYGKQSKKATPVKVKVSETTESLKSPKNSEYGNYYFDDDGKAAIADFSIYDHKLTGKVNGKEHYPTIENLHLHNIRQMILGYGNGAKMYGKKLPSEAVDGQLFFLIKE